MVIFKLHLILIDPSKMKMSTRYLRGSKLISMRVVSQRMGVQYAVPSMDLITQNKIITLLSETNGRWRLTESYQKA